jgi:hypothetical protein
MYHEIDSGVAVPEDFRRRIEHFKPLVLYFNGKRAAKVFYRSISIEFGSQPGRIGASLVFVATSTSSAANRTWDAGQWRELAGLAEECSSSG